MCLFVLKSSHLGCQKGFPRLGVPWDCCAHHPHHSLLLIFLSCHLLLSFVPSFMLLIDPNLDIPGPNHPILIRKFTRNIEIWACWCPVLGCLFETLAWEPWSHAYVSIGWIGMSFWNLGLIPVVMAPTIGWIRRSCREGRLAYLVLLPVTIERICVLSSWLQYCWWWITFFINCFLRGCFCWNEVWCTDV